MYLSSSSTLLIPSLLPGVIVVAEAFQLTDHPQHWHAKTKTKTRATPCYAVGGERGGESATTNEDENNAVSSDNKAMAFLRKIGKVGGNADFTNAMGVDEGPAGKTAGGGGGGMRPVRKSKSGYKAVQVDGIVDDMSEPFPVTSSGTQWTGFTDQVMGGKSSGSITREVVDGKLANVLRGKVSTENNGGFVQMATDLALDPSVSRTVDMSAYDGVELSIIYQGDRPAEDFNVHLKNNDCERQFSSYRGTFSLPRGEWTTIRIPWSGFIGKGPGAEGAELNVSTLRRIGIVAIGREMEVAIGVSSVSFYRVL